MMSISSKAGKRLAKARAALHEIDAGNPNDLDPAAVRVEFFDASAEVADELCSQRFHEMEGD